MKALVINGPNINLLGIREPDIYGEDSYQDLVTRCKQAGAELGFNEIECFQSNHEGAIIDKIQAAYGVFDGIVINPAAYTHTSVGILDALKAVTRRAEGRQPARRRGAHLRRREPGGLPAGLLRPPRLLRNDYR